MDELNFHHVNMHEDENQKNHRTQGLSSGEALVVRRGSPFRVSLQLKGRPFDPNADTLMLKAVLGSLYVTMPVTFSKDRPSSSSSWRAYFSQENPNPLVSSILISTPASAAVGSYTLQLFVMSETGQRGYVVGNFVLLCNPWCSDDTAFIPFEDQREEFVLNDSGLIFTGMAKNISARPWSFDQFEPGVLEACMDLLQVSPQHLSDQRKDLYRRANPVYLSRVVSAMINCEDDRGVLKGNWSGDYKDGCNPSKWTGSGDILKQWAKSGFRPVKYGQCWVFGAVMCTVMRVLGIPCRVVTNFNSAHDRNGNLVIEEFYNERGMKLHRSQDSIWNFHVWVECWMTRPDLGSDCDGWQVLDPTPQERSRGVFCCGPAPVKAIRERRLDMIYDVPFVFAEVNADVHTFLVRQGQILDRTIDTQRVGSVICTKAIGFPAPQNITADYKKSQSMKATLRSRRNSTASDSTLSRRSSHGMSVSLSLDKTPVAGKPIPFTVMISNHQAVAKVIKEHANAQAKEYNHSPSETFWEVHNTIHLAPMEVKVLHHLIIPAAYDGEVGDDLVNLAVVLEDQATKDCVLASEEFNIVSPELIIQIADEKNIVLHEEQTALLSFINPFGFPVSGVLTVAGAGLIRGKLHCRLQALQPGGRVGQRFKFTPRMSGTKMLQASLTLSDSRKIIRGFKMVHVVAE